MTEISDKAARLRSQADFLESLERASAADRDFLVEVHRLLGRMFANGTYEPGGIRTRYRKPGKAVKKVLALFTAEDVWLTVPQILDQTGLARGVVTNILYKSRKDQFEQRDHPTSGKLKLWRLKPQFRK